MPRTRLAGQPVRYARYGDQRISYEVRGTLRRWRPWLVLVQGMGLDRSGWGPALRGLGRHFRLVLVDNRGTGHSDQPPGSFGVRDMAADVLAVLDDLGIHRAHVLGVSLGGMVAQELAIGHAARVDGLVLVSTAPGWPFAYPMPAVTAGLIAVSGGLPGEQALHRHAENALSATTLQRQPELAGQIADLLRTGPAAPGARAAQAAAGARYLGQLRQQRIRSRTLVLHGGADRVVDPRNARLLASRIPGARLVIFPELGHLICWEDPDGFTAAVSSFLLETTPGEVGTGRDPARPDVRGWARILRLGQRVTRR